MVRLIERYLTEDIEAVKKHYSYIPEDEFNFIIQIDPTFNPNSNSVGKYGKWLLGLYKKHDTYLDDMMDCFREGNKAEIEYTMNDIKGIIAKYDSYKNDRTKVIERDVMRLKSIAQMNTSIEEAGEAELSKKQAQRQAKKDKPYDMVFDGGKYAIFVPKNHEGDMILASFGGSSKATWCTAADSENGQWRYDYYLEKGGKYYVLINKNNYEDKYQFHFESDQFMDSENDSINLDKFYDENQDVAQFFQKEGYSEDWEPGSGSIQELVDSIGSTAQLGTLWYSIRPKEWELLDNFFNACYNKDEEEIPDEFIKAVEKILPKFKKMDDTEENKRNLISKLIIRSYDKYADSRKMSEALSQNGIPITHAYDSWWGEIDSNEIRTYLRDFLVDGTLDEDDFWNVTYENVFNAFSMNREIPEGLSDDEYEEMAEEQDEDFGYDYDDANNSERYFCMAYPDAGEGKIIDVIESFVKAKFGSDNLQNTIEKILLIQFSIDGEISGPFEDVDGESLVEKHLWNLYYANLTIDKVRKYMGTSYEEADTETRKEMGVELLKKIPISEMQVSTVTLDELKKEMMFNSYFKFAVSFDKSKYYFHQHDEEEDYEGAWVEKLGLEDSRRVENLGLALAESRKRIKMREK